MRICALIGVAAALVTPQTPSRAVRRRAADTGDEFDRRRAADRVFLDLRATPEMEQCVQKLDQQVLAYVEANVKKYFGNTSKEKVREYFRPTLK